MTRPQSAKINIILGVFVRVYPNEISIWIGRLRRLTSSMWTDLIQFVGGLNRAKGQIKENIFLLADCWWAGTLTFSWTHTRTCTTGSSESPVCQLQILGLLNLYNCMRKCRYTHTHIYALIKYKYHCFSSVAQSCPTLCDPMNRSTPGLPVHHQLQEFTQTHVHQVGDAIQLSHPLSSPSPPAPNPSQHQSFLQWVNSSYEVAKVLEFQL